MRYLNIFIVLLFIACGRSAHEGQFDRAENLLLSAPDSAVSIIDSLRRDSSRLSRAELMHLRIIMADQLNKTYQPIALTPELQEAVAWYDRHGTPNEMMRAYYLLAGGYRDNGDAPKAIENYNMAIDKAEPLTADCDKSLLARVHGQAGDILYKQCLKSEAIREYDKACGLALAEKDTLSYWLYKDGKTHCYYDLNMLDSAMINCESVYNGLVSIGQQEYANCTLPPLIYTSLIKEENEKARKYLILFTNQTLRLPDDSARQAKAAIYKGMYLTNTQHYDSAQACLEKARSLSDNIYDDVLVNKCLYNLYKKSGQRDSLLKYSELYVETSDSSVVQLQWDVTQRTHALYRYNRYQRQAIAKTAEAEKEHVRVFLLISLCLLLLVSGGTLFIYLRKRSKLRITKLQMRLDDACEELQSTESDLAMLRLNNAEAVASLRKEKEKKEQQLHKTITELTELLDASHKDNGHPYTKTGTDDEVDTFIRLFRQSPVDHPITSDKWKRIIRYIKRANPRFYEKIWRNDSLSIVEKKLCVLIYLGIKPSLISTALDRSSQDVTNMRTRLLMRVFGMKGGAKDFDSLICKI